MQRVSLDPLLPHFSSHRWRAASPANDLVGIHDPWLGVEVRRDGLGELAVLARVICPTAGRITLSAIWWQLTHFRFDQDGCD